MAVSLWAPARHSTSAEGCEHRLNQSDEVSNHGIKIGMGRTQNEEKMAVECGYSLFSADAIEAPLELLHLWHFNPAEEEAGQNGFHLDSKEPDFSKFRALATPTLLHFGNAQASLALRSTSAAPIMGEVRYNSLMKTFPEQAEELFVATENFAKQRYEGYKKLAE